MATPLVAIPPSCSTASGSRSAEPPSPTARMGRRAPNTRPTVPSRSTVAASPSTGKSSSAPPMRGARAVAKGRPVCTRPRSPMRENPISRSSKIRAPVAPATSSVAWTGRRADRQPVEQGRVRRWWSRGDTPEYRPMGVCGSVLPPDRLTTVPSNCGRGKRTGSSQRSRSGP